jgi:hypothetical protein
MYCNHIADTDTCDVCIESVSVFGEYGVIGGNSAKRTATIVAHTKIE